MRNVKNRCFVALSVVLVSCCSLGCTDVPQPFDLDHARVMAVRIDPPSLPPDQVATIDVLVTDAAAQPYQAPVASVRVTLPAALVAAGLGDTLQQTATGWQLTSPDAATMASIRMALNKTSEEPLVVPLDIEVTTADGTLIAQKTVAFGPLALNPAVPTITQNDVVTALTMEPGVEATLSVQNPVDDHSYRWFSSVGDLKGFTRAQVRVDPIAGPAGLIVVVVRDQAGGTSWAMSPVAAR